MWLWASGRVSIYSFVYHIYHACAVVKSKTFPHNLYCGLECVSVSYTSYFICTLNKLFVLYCIKSSMAPSLLQPFRVSTALSRLHTAHYASHYVQNMLSMYFVQQIFHTHNASAHSALCFTDLDSVRSWERLSRQNCQNICWTSVHQLRLLGKFRGEKPLWTWVDLPA